MWALREWLTDNHAGYRMCPLSYHGRYVPSGHLIYMQQGTPEGSTQAPEPAHEIVMILNFADELRRRVPVG